MKRLVLIAFVFFAIANTMFGQEFNVGITFTGNAALGVEGFGKGWKCGGNITLPNKTDPTFALYGDVGYGFPITNEEYLVIRPSGVVGGWFNSINRLFIGLDMMLQFKAPQKYSKMKHLGAYVRVTWGKPVTTQPALEVGDGAKLVPTLGVSFVLWLWRAQKQWHC